MEVIPNAEFERPNRGYVKRERGWERCHKFRERGLDLVVAIRHCAHSAHGDFAAWHHRQSRTVAEIVPFARPGYHYALKPVPSCPLDRSLYAHERNSEQRTAIDGAA